MKRVIIISLGFLFMFASCQAQAEKEENMPSMTTFQSEANEDVNIETEPFQEVQEISVVDKPVEINTEEYIKLIHDFKTFNFWKFNGDKPCVVDFYADWCRPCKMMEPTMEKLAKEYAGKVNFYKVNVDNNRELAQAYGVSSIPFFLFCSNNGQPQASMGMMSEEDMRNVIESMLK